jgi:UDP-N-acetylmuramoyl-L-alanyl-D-glutamate--2,6-diaminopimelate ligase
VPCGFLGTTGYGYRDVMYQASTTTPSPVALYQLLAEMKSAGVDACSMEVSSHALDQSRVRVHDFNVAIFTNLTRDHLDYHESADAYFAAKKRLFDGLPETATAVVNADDPFGTKIAKDTDARIVSFGTRNDADIRYEILEDGAAGLKMRIEDLTGSFKLSGRFNAENIAAAYSAGLSLGFSAENVINALTTARPAKGRFEAFTSANARVVIIDYAHTPDALRNVLAEARRRTNGKSALWCVFGCGGDRDTGKRPLMGAIAEELADHVVITNDNPRSEDPKLILNDIRAGMNHPDLATWCPDRRDAIRFVEAQSHAEDVVVIAGKGHETRQIIGHVSQEFDDSIEACAAFGIKNSGGGNEAVVTI